MADAIERGDLGDLRDELGDLLLQVILHAQFAAEAGDFVVTIAGPNAEAQIAGRGSGAARWSSDHYEQVTSVDIGTGARHPVGTVEGPAGPGVLHELNGLADQGHVLFPRDGLCERAASMLEVDVGHVGPALDSFSTRALAQGEAAGIAFGASMGATSLAALRAKPAATMSALARVIGGAW